MSTLFINKDRVTSPTNKHVLQNILRGKYTHEICIDSFSHG